MKEKFKEYYPLEKADYEKLWKKGLFIFDTSIMLNTYRCSIPLLDQFMLILDRLEKRIWLPNQVGREFLKNRKGVMFDVEKFYDDYIEHIKNTFDNAKQKVLEDYCPQKSYKYLEDDLKKLNKKILKYQKNINDEIDKKEEEIIKQIIKEKELIISTEKDDILNKITSKFTGKVGEAFSEEDLKKIYEEGAKRYLEKRPPGYKDQNKDGNDKYGDLVLWKEIIKIGETKKIPIILVIDDKKDDWWWEVRGETQGAKVELIREITAKTDDLFYMYDFKNFLKYSNEYLLKEGEKTSPTLLNEAEKISSIGSLRFIEYVNKEIKIDNAVEIIDNNTKKLFKKEITSLVHKNKYRYADRILAKNFKGEEIPLKYFSLTNSFIDQIIKCIEDVDCIIDNRDSEITKYKGKTFSTREDFQYYLNDKIENSLEFDEEYLYNKLDKSQELLYEAICIVCNDIFNSYYC